MITDIFVFPKIIDDVASTRFFKPRVYDSNNAAEVQQLLNDLDSIMVMGGGDYPEYGMNGISRVIDASVISVPDPFNHILLFTDAPPIDYNIKNAVQSQLVPSADGPPTTLLHGFLPSYLDQPCGAMTVEECYSSTGRAYIDLIEATNGILVSSLTQGGFEDFIRQHNALFDTSYPEVSCNARRKRLVTIPIDGLYCKNETVSELARKLTLLVTPLDDSVTFTVTPPTAKSAQISRSATVTQVIGYDDPTPGIYTVCANEAFELDAKITNHFPFSVEFFSPTSDIPYLLTLPPPGCLVNVTLFSPDINKLSFKGAHHLELVSTAGSVIGQVPVINRGCSSHYIRGSNSINLPNEDFNVCCSGVSKGGYPFEANLVRRYTHLNFHHCNFVL